MIRTENQTPVGRGDFQLVESRFHSYHIADCQFQTPRLFIPASGRRQNGSGRSVFIRTQGMGRLGEFTVVYRVGMAFFHPCDLVVAQCIQLIVGNRGYFRLELVEADGDVSVFQFLQGNGISRVVDQHVWVDTDIDEMDYIVIHYRRAVGHAIEPCAFKAGPQRLDQFARPDFR